MLAACWHNNILVYNKYQTVFSVSLNISLEFLLTMSIQYQPDKWWEYRKYMRIISWSKNCMVDSEENYKFDLGVKGLKLKIYWWYQWCKIIIYHKY